MDYSVAHVALRRLRKGEVRKHVLLFCVLGALPQSDREALVLERVQVQQESRLRNNHPAHFAARQALQPVSRVQVNVYASSHNIGIGSPGYGMP
jgi:hypothetical protein